MYIYFGKKYTASNLMNHPELKCSTKTIKHYSRENTLNFTPDALSF